MKARTPNTVSTPVFDKSTPGKVRMEGALDKGRDNRIRSSTIS